MIHPRKPRGAFGELLYAAKLRSGKEWPEIGLEARVNKTTREGWVTGETAEPGLAGALRLCRALGITADELVACILDGRLPEWATGDAQGRVVGSSAADAMAAKAARREGTSRRPRANGQGRA